MQLSRSVVRCEKLVSHSHKFLFIAVPKAARTSLLAVLRAEELGAEDVSRVPIGDVLTSTAYDGYYKFAFIRNPWGRVFSAWLSKVAKARSESALAFLAQHEGLYAGMPFPDFVSWLMGPAAADEAADRHWVSQHKFVCDAHLDVRVDFLGRYETLQSDFDEVCDAIGIHRIKLPLLNARNRHGIEYREEENMLYHRSFYDERTARLVGERYATDIDLFGFSS